MSPTHARQCELHSARVAAQWWAASSLFPPPVARGCRYSEQIKQHIATHKRCIDKTLRILELELDGNHPKYVEALLAKVR